MYMLLTLILSLMGYFPLLMATQEQTQQEFAEYLGYRLWHDLKELTNCSFTMQDVVNGMQKAEKNERMTIDPKALQHLYFKLITEQAQKSLKDALSQSEAHLKKILATKECFSLEDGKLLVEILKEGSGKEIAASNLFHLKGGYDNGAPIIKYL